MSVVTISETDKVPLFQHEVTGYSVVTHAADNRFELTWSIHKDNVSSISCDGDFDVIIWVKTRSSNTFKDSFDSCEYIGLYSSRSVASIFARLLTINVIIFIMWLCVCVNTCIYCCQEQMVNKIQVH